MDKKYLFGGYILIALIAIIFLPRLDKAVFPSSTGPGAITVFGVGLVFTLLTLLLFYTFYKEKNLTKGFFVSAVLYSFFIILTRLVLSPLSLYQANEVTSFDSTFFGPIGMFFISIGIFVLYFVALYILYRYFKHRANIDINVAEEKKPMHLKSKILRIIGMILVAGLVIIIPGAVMGPLLILIFPLVGTVSYLSYIFSTTLGIMIAVSLVAAVAFVTTAFHNVTEQAVKMRDVGFVATFFWLCASVLFVYSILWFVYLLTLVALWPLRTFTPK